MSKSSVTLRFSRRGVALQSLCYSLPMAIPVVLVGHWGDEPRLYLFALVVPLVFIGFSLVFVPYFYRMTVCEDGVRFSVFPVMIKWKEFTGCGRTSLICKSGHGSGNIKILPRLCYENLDEVMQFVLEHAPEGSAAHRFAKRRVRA